METPVLIGQVELRHRKDKNVMTMMNMDLDQEYNCPLTDFNFTFLSKVNDSWSDQVEYEENKKGVKVGPGLDELDSLDEGAPCLYFRNPNQFRKPESCSLTYYFEKISKTQDQNKLILKDLRIMSKDSGILQVRLDLNQYQDQVIQVQEFMNLDSKDNEVKMVTSTTYFPGPWSRVHETILDLHPYEKVGIRVNLDPDFVKGQGQDPENPDTKDLEKAFSVLDLNLGGCFEC